MTAGQHSDSLNEHQSHYLLVTCQHIDKILSDVEEILNESTAKAAFPSYFSDLTPVQRKTIEDYISHIRARLIQILEGQGVNYKQTGIPASKAIRSRLYSIDIAAEELKPKHMRGYGEISDTVATELNGIAGELQGLVTRLDGYLGEGIGQDLRTRLKRLEDAGNDLELLSRIEQVVTKRGLVEFRGAIDSILDRAEDRSFEIAVFGRVSSGKSSLLNAVLDAHVLPVGVTPVTAVPVRITCGEKEALEVSFADSQKKTYEVLRLAEFATEQQNPGNTKHVARVTVTIPSPRLCNGISFVDTPGLGSFATSGAAETLAYLPKCDLGVVLIDAGSTLTEVDLRTILALQKAMIPAHVLLSKADLLNQQDCEKTVEYIRQHIISEAGQDLSVYPVSVQPSHLHLLNQWFEKDIFPFYSRSQKLRKLSLQIKIGALKESIVSILQNKIRQNPRSSAENKQVMPEVEARLLKATGLIEETRSACEREIQKTESNIPDVFFTVAVSIIEPQSQNEYSGIKPENIIHTAILRVVQEQAKTIQGLIETLALRLQNELVKSAEELTIAEIPIAEIPGKDEFLSFIRDMPVFDPGTIQVSVQKSMYSALLGKKFAEKELAKQIRQQLGKSFENSLFSYLNLLRDWSKAITGEIGQRFETYAELYRAQAERSSGKHELKLEEVRAIEDDLILLGGLVLDNITDAGN
ncbi:dynamin family protein [Methanosarcina hadiensis]|uniref:dynamin family protein n=1 Tax=Methanosarcina hadiensis TaxID=3078083 RepID=UPI00397766E1